LRFTVLASGSGGNASLLETQDFGLLIDIGLGPRQLAHRLASAQAAWARVRAVLLTHTHTDHWNERTFLHLRRLCIPLYCHVNHHGSLLAYSPAFADLLADNLVRAYHPDEPLTLSPGLACRPFRLRHDGDTTCGFRFERLSGLFGDLHALGYAADLGSWDIDLVRALADVDLLALEFNHDVFMEQSSGRSLHLITRVLGDEGHLSNSQAAALLTEVIQGSAPGRLRQIVQLHLSRDCNHPKLATAAVADLLNEFPGIGLHTAAQDSPSPTFHLDAGGTGWRRMLPALRRKRSSGFIHPWLPGMEPPAISGQF
jgi:phosphoribosyl 1,2-cyclic phosphodiesterase